MKGVGAFFKKSATGIILSLICCVMLFVGIGFAQITKPLNIQGDVNVEAQEGIFIVSVEYSDEQNVSADKNYINECYSTIFNANIQLHETDIDSYVGFIVRIYNKYTVPYRYFETKKIDSVYQNDNITFEVLDAAGANPLQQGTIIDSNSYLDFKIMFKYSDSANMSAVNHHIAQVCVNFDFNVYVQPVLSDNMVPVEYNSSTLSWQRADTTSFNYADYDNGIWANAITYDHSKVYSQNEHTTNGGTWFNGTSYYINYRHENYDFDNTITVGARFKWVGSGSGTIAYLVCNLENAGFGMFVATSSLSGFPVGTLGFRILNDAGETIDICSNTLVADNAWHTFIVTYDGQQVKLFVNGVLDKTASLTSNIKPSPVGINVGRNPPDDNGAGGSFHLNGNVSHVLVLDDTLTDVDARKIYDSNFAYSTNNYNQIIHLDTTSRDSNGKYFDGLNDGGYNMGLTGHNYNQNNLAKFSIATKFNALTLKSLNASTDQHLYLACCLETYGYGFGLVQPKGTMELKLYFAFYNDSTGFIYATANESVSLKTWHNAVVTIDGYYIRMYLDGREQTLSCKNADGEKVTLGSQLKLKNSSVRVALGGNPGKDSVINRDWYNGWIKECVIFKKALTNAEISRDFANDFTFHYKKYSTSPSSTDVLQYVKCDYDNIILQSDQSYTEEGIVLDGQRDYVSVGLGAHNFSSSLSVIIRLKFPSPISTATQTIFSNFENAGFSLKLINGKTFRFSTQKAQVKDENGNVTSAETTIDIDATNVVVQPNTWYTVVCVVTDLGPRLYINGVQEAIYSVNTAHAFVLKNSMHPIFIGANPDEGKYSELAKITVSDFAFINQGINKNLVTQYFVGEISPSLARANCFLNFVGYQYRSTDQSIPDEMVNGFFTWIPRFKIKSTLNSGEVDIEIVSKETEAHDAFTFDNQNVDGFWFAKFETSLDNNGFVQIASNATPYITDDISTMFDRIKLAEQGNSDFDVEAYQMLDIHMSKNAEWGAMAYLSQSKYGLFRTGEYVEIQENTSDLTGYYYEYNTNQSTNQNVTGIYDIVGGMDEYVMAKYDTTGDGGVGLIPDVKYYDLYSTLSSYYESGLYHAMGESPSYPPDADSVFVNSTAPWLIRTGLFDYSAATGAAGYSARISLFIVE